MTFLSLIAVLVASCLAHDSGLDITSPDKWKCGAMVFFNWSTEALPPATQDWCQSASDTVTLALFNLDADSQVFASLCFCRVFDNAARLSTEPSNVFFCPS